MSENANRDVVEASPLRARLAGAVVAGIVFLALLLGGPFDDGEPAAWGVALLGAMSVIALFSVLVLASARPNRLVSGRLSADFVTVFAGTVTFVVIGYPIAALIGLVNNGV